jgi:hypothetical protein
VIGSQRAKAAKLRLKRQGDPAGIMSGDGLCVDGEGNNAPAPHRATKSEFEIVSITHATGRDKSSEAWRVVRTIERMHRNKQITDEEYKAAQDFHKYFTLGHRVGGLTMRYGEQTGCGGAPPGQQVDAPNHRSEVRLTPDELRAIYNGLWASGVKALLTANPPGTDHLIATWVQRIVCEDYSVLEDKAPTLTDCGTAYTGCKCRRQAQAIGASLIKQGLERLAAHYGIGKRRPA